MPTVPLIRIAGQQIGGVQPSAVIARVLRAAAAEGQGLGNGAVRGGQHGSAEEKS